MNATLEKTAEALKGLKRALVCTHISPDADAIGSAGAISLLLRSLGVDAKVYLSEPLPERFAELAQEIIFTHQVSPDAIDSLVVVDTASAPRLGPESEALRGAASQVINIDHHGSNTEYGTLNWIEPTTPATAVMVEQLYGALSQTPSARAANLLYAGLMDDTGSFRYSNTTALAFECASRLVAAGAEPESVANCLYFSVPERVLRLKARALSELKVVLDGRVAFIAVSDEMLQSCGAEPGDTEGVVDIARSLEGVQAAAFFREMDSGWKVSLRAKDSAVDVNAIAAQFGGGGHRAAAGCRVDGSREEAEALISKAFEKELA